LIPSALGIANVGDYVGFKAKFCQYFEEPFAAAHGACDSGTITSGASSLAVSQANLSNGTSEFSRA